MKKFALILSIFFAVLFASAISFAEDMDPQGPPPSDDQQYDAPREERQYQRRDRQEGPSEGREGGMNKMGGKKMDMMKGGMMGGMHQQVVATSDGGVVILSGGKLSKYDAQLNLINEVELKKDKSPKHADAKNERAHHAATEEASGSEAIPTPQFAPPATEAE